jgi:predicted PurR-regulated permease PerM
MWATLVLVFIALSFCLLYWFNEVVFILLIAIVMGTVIRPVVTWLHRQGLPRIAAVALVYFLLLTLLISFVLLVFPLIVEQGTTTAAAVPGYYQGLRAWMVDYPNQLIVRLSEFLPATLSGLEPNQQTGQQMLDFAGQAAGYAVSTAQLIFMATAILMLAFHWTLDGQRSIQSLLLLVPLRQRQGISELFAALETKVGFYIVGQAVLCLSVGILALVAYLLIGLPNALVLALVAGVMEVVPLVGPLLGAVPAAVIALAIAPSKLAWVIVATLVIQQLENAILVPRVMRRAVGVNPFISLLAIFAFSSLFGFLGALMAVPIAAIIQLVLDRFVFNPVALEPEVSPNRDYSGRLRYEAHDLAQDLRKQARFREGGSDLGDRQLDQLMDEIETITIDLDALLAQVRPSGAP